MSVKQLWQDGYSDLGTAVKACLSQKQEVPKPVAVLLKQGLNVTSAADAFDKAIAKKEPKQVQQAFLDLQKSIHAMGGPLADSHTAIHDNMEQSLADAVMMFTSYPLKTQTAADKARTDLIEELDKGATDDDAKLLLSIRKLMSSSSFAADWEEGKKDFKKHTDEKKPAEKKWGIRQSTHIHANLKDLDSACVKASPSAYEDAWKKWDKARGDYVKLLDNVIAKEKDDTDYQKGCKSLKTLLTSIQTRVDGLLKLLEDLEKDHPQKVFS